MFMLEYRVISDDSMYQSQVQIRKRAKEFFPHHKILLTYKFNFEQL